MVFKEDALESQDARKMGLRVCGATQRRFMSNILFYKKCQFFFFNFNRFPGDPGGAWGPLKNLKNLKNLNILKKHKKT